MGSAAPAVPPVEFRPSPIHGTGGFATVRVTRGTRLLQYLGRRISKAESRRQCQAQNSCIFYFNDEMDLDGGVEFNPARFLNHSCHPNCEAIRTEREEIWIAAKRDIEAGEELTFNYGYELEQYRDHPCQCGAAGCVGYIVAEEYHTLVRLEAAVS